MQIKGDAGLTLFFQLLIALFQVRVEKDKGNGEWWMQITILAFKGQNLVVPIGKLHLAIENKVYYLALYRVIELLV